MSTNDILDRYTEDFMADLAKEAMGLWDGLEKDSGTSLRWMSGLLNFGDKDYGGDSPEGGLFSQRGECLAISSLTFDRNVVGTNYQPR